MDFFKGRDDNRGYEGEEKRGNKRDDIMSGLGGAALGAFAEHKWDEHRENKRREENWDDMDDDRRGQRERQLREDWEGEQRQLMSEGRGPYAGGGYGGADGDYGQRGGDYQAGGYQQGGMGRAGDYQQGGYQQGGYGQYGNEGRRDY